MKSRFVSALLLASAVALIVSGAFVARAAHSEIIYPTQALLHAG